MDLLDRSDAFLRSLADDPARLRVVVRWAAVLVTAWSCSVSVAFDENSGAVIAAPFVLVAGAGAVRLLPRWRSVLLAVAAGGVAIVVPDAEWLAPAVASLLVLALVESPERVPWFPLLATLLGSIASLAFFHYEASVSPFVAGTVGGALGLLVRSAGRSGRLEQ